MQVKMSYIEIYNEIIRDLLNPSAGPLELRDEGGSGAPVVAGLSELRANSAAHVAELLARGDRSRTAEPTHANQHSSRGHALLRYFENTWRSRRIKNAHYLLMYQVSTNKKVLVKIVQIMTFAGWLTEVRW